MKKVVAVTIIAVAVILLALCFAQRGTQVAQGPKPNVPCKACVVQGPRPNVPCMPCVFDTGHHPGGPMGELNYGYQYN